MKKGLLIITMATILFSISPIFAENYSEEQQEAYNYAYEHGITTSASIDKANMKGSLTRIAMAKMISNFAINVLGLHPDTSKDCSFSDVSNSQDAQYNYGVTQACQLGLMGIGSDGKKSNTFNPNSTVTRGQRATTFSRALSQANGEAVQEGQPYYKAHLEYLKYNGIIKDANNPTHDSIEKRGNVMIMMYRANELLSYYDLIGDFVGDFMNSMFGSLIENVIYEDALQYNNYLVSLVDSCYQTEDAVWDAYNNGNSKEIQNAVDSLILTCNSALNDLSNIDSFDGDYSLKNGILDVIEKNISYYNKFNELIPYMNIENMSKNDEAIYKTKNSELGIIGAELDKANSNLVQIQETFAINHNYQLEQSTLKNDTKNSTSTSQKNSKDGENVVPQASTTIDLSGKTSLTIGDLDKIDTVLFPKGYTYDIYKWDDNERSEAGEYIYPEDIDHTLLIPVHATIVNREVISSSIEDGMIYTNVEAISKNGAVLSILYINNPDTLQYVAASVNENNKTTLYTFQY